MGKPLRIYFAIQQGFHQTALARAMGPRGRALYLGATDFCATNLTDGFIADSQLALIYRATSTRLETLDRLIYLGVFQRVSGGVLLTDYLTLNRSRARIEEIREARSKAGITGNVGRWGDRGDIANATDSSVASAIERTSQPVPVHGSGTSGERVDARNPSPDESKASTHQNSAEPAYSAEEERLARLILRSNPNPDPRYWRNRPGMQAAITALKQTGAA